MSKVFFDGIGIVDHQHFSGLSVTSQGWRGFDALLRALFRTGVWLLNATLRVADPAVHGFGVAGKRYRGHQCNQGSGK